MDTLSLAEIYYQNGKKTEPTNQIEAARWYNKSLILTEKIGPSYELGRLYVRLGGISYGFGLNEEGSEYFKKARKVILESKSEKGYRQFRSLFENPEEYNKKTVLKTQIDYADAHELMLAAQNFEKSSDLKEPRLYISRAIDFFRKSSDTEYLLAISLFTSSRIETKGSNFDKAKKKLKEAEKIYLNKFIDNNNLTIIYLNSRIYYYQATGNFQQSYIFLEKLKILEVKNITADREAAISKLKIEFETKEKEEQLNRQKGELNLKELDLKFQRNLLFISLFILLIITAGSIYLFRLLKVNQRISKKNSLLLVEQNHRVKNNLQFISSMLNIQKDVLIDTNRKSEIEAIQLRIESMAILQRALYSTEKLAEVNLSNFIDDIVTNVLNSCNANETAVILNINTINVSADASLCIGLIINELTVNSCKHAFGKSISIRSELIDDYVEIVYKDDGNGLPSNKLNSSIKQGFGYELIIMLTEQLNGVMELKSTNDIYFKFLLKKLTV